MSLPNFPSGDRPTPSAIFTAIPLAGAGDHLPVWLLALCGAFTAVASGVSVMSITLQLKNYRKPALQRAVVRIMVMVPLYAISSLIALFSLEAAFFIDAVRDLYEAFVIYTFFQLLITYLGGERSLLIILHGRPPIPHPFPVNVFLRPMDVSDPWTLLNLKRGVLQYVQVKPALVVTTVILKLTGKYREGEFAVDSGYTYISVIYNTSICLSLYCLAMFWVCVSTDLKPFRPVPKFLCVKGILFFSFWQSIGISFLVAVHAIKKVGVYTDPEHMSLALVDSLICFEMPIFAIAHQYAFQASDYFDAHLKHAARLPFVYAFRDAFGLKDVWEDTKDTFRGHGVSYQTYEPAEGGLHYGAGRQKRIRAGLRYSKGGKAKYWMPIPGDEARNRGETGPLASIKRRVDERLAAREGYAPLLPQQIARIVHEDPNGIDDGQHVEWGGLFDSESEGSDAPSLEFESVDEDENGLYERARRIGYAGFPNVDVSREEKRRRQWEEEDGILAGRWNRGGPRDGDDRNDSGRKRGLGEQRRSSRMKRKGKGKEKEGNPKRAVYGAWADRISQVDKSSKANGHARRPSGDGDLSDEDDTERYDHRHSNGDQPHLRRTDKQRHKSLQFTHAPFFTIGEDEDKLKPAPQHEGRKSPKGRPLPNDARDLVVEDPQAVEQAQARERRRGEPQTKAPTHVYLHHETASGHEDEVDEIEEVFDPANREEKKRSEALPGREMPGGDPVDQVERIEERAINGTAGSTTINESITSWKGYEHERNPWS